ncbi:MAG: ABC transporter permease subunit [Pirellulaceae bacterium]
MNRLLLKKAILECRTLWLGCAVALALFCSIRVWIVAQFSMERFQTIVEQFREFEKLSPVPFEQLFTYAGRIAVTFDEPIVVLCIAVWAIARGSDCVSGELGRGTMEMLLAQPFRRSQIIGSQAAVTVVGAALLMLVTWLSIYIGVQLTTVKEEPPPATWKVPLFGFEVPNLLADPEPVEVPMSERVDSRVFAPATFNLFCLTVFLAGLSTLLSSMGRHRSTTIGIMVGIYIVAAAMKILAVASESWSWLRYGTFFMLYEPQAITQMVVKDPSQAWVIVTQASETEPAALGPLGYSLPLLGLGVLAYLLAGLIFQRRDLPAPL